VQLPEFFDEDESDKVKITAMLTEEM